MNQNGPRELFPAFEFKEARLLRTKEFVFYVTYLSRAEIKKYVRYTRIQNWIDIGLDSRLD